MFVNIKKDLLHFCNIRQIGACQSLKKGIQIESRTVNFTDQEVVTKGTHTSKDKFLQKIEQNEKKLNQNSLNDANEKVLTCQKVNENNPDLCVPNLSLFSISPSLPILIHSKKVTDDFTFVRESFKIEMLSFIFYYKLQMWARISFIIIWSPSRLAMNFFSFSSFFCYTREFVSGVKLKMENRLAALKPFLAPTE